MSHLRAFFRQPARRYRNFQLVYALLTLNFVLPAISYTLFPQVAIDQFLDLNAKLGGAAYTFPEADSAVWRYLGAANVMTLGFCCLLLQLDLRRFFPVLVPLTFMKFYAASCWLVGWFYHPEYRFFLAAAVLDFVTCTAFVWFATRARKDLDEHGDQQVVPRPLGSRRAAASAGASP